jgi:hypothetical protein
MRYMCTTCGEAEMRFEGEDTSGVSALDENASETSSITECAENPRLTDIGTVYPMPKARTGSLSTHASADLSRTSSGINGSAEPRLGIPVTKGSAMKGYELCPNCIEVHGSAHSKEKAAMTTGHSHQGQLAHTFREKIWGQKGWVDIGKLSKTATLTG